jgi:hypothetical protein
VPSSVCFTTNHRRCNVGLSSRPICPGFLVLGDHAWWILPGAQCARQSIAEQDYSLTLSEISRAQAAFTTLTWAFSRCSKFESDVFHCIKTVEPVADVWRMDLGQGHIRKWRTPMFQGTTPYKICRLLRSKASMLSRKN